MINFSLLNSVDTIFPMGPTFEVISVIHLYHFVSKVFIWQRNNNIWGIVTGAAVSTVAEIMFLQGWVIDWEERNLYFRGSQDLST